MIKDYVAFTNESLRTAVKEYSYSVDTAAAERRHGKMGTWDAVWKPTIQRGFSVLR